MSCDLLSIYFHFWRFKTLRGFLNYFPMFHGHFMTHEYRIRNVCDSYGPWQIFNDPWNSTFWWRKNFMAMKKRFSWWRKKFMAMKNFFHGGGKISWPWKTFFTGCVKGSYIIHWKFMAINEGHEIDNSYIHDHEKRFMGFFLNISWDFHWTHVGSDSMRLTEWKPLTYCLY